MNYNVILVLTIVIVFILSIFIYYKNQEWYSQLNKPNWYMEYGTMILLWVCYMIGRLLLTIDVEKDSYVNFLTYISCFLYLISKYVLFVNHDIELALKC